MARGTSSAATAASDSSTGPDVRPHAYSQPDFSRESKNSPFGIIRGGEATQRFTEPKVIGSQAAGAGSTLGGGIYDISWDRGALGISLSKRETCESGARVSRVTGRGTPFGLKQVQLGDTLLAIDDEDVTELSIKQIVKMLQNSSLPVKLRFQNTRPSEFELQYSSASLRGIDENYEGDDANLEEYTLSEDHSQYVQGLGSQPISMCESPIHTAAKEGNLSALLRAIRDSDDKKILLRREDRQEQTALHLAVRYGHYDVIEALCDYHQPVEELLNVQDKSMNTALHFAVRKTTAITELLVSYKAGTEFYNKQGMTPLMVNVLMSQKDDNRISKILLQAKADPNCFHEEKSLLSICVERKLFRIAGSLIHAGAQITTSDGKQTIFDSLPSRKITKYLINKIYYPPVKVDTKSRKDCMLCNTKISFAMKKYNCEHCGRVACKECCSVFVELHRFPEGFPGRITTGAKAVGKKQRCCKTCFNLFKEPDQDPIVLDGLWEYVTKAT